MEPAAPNPNKDAYDSPLFEGGRGPLKAMGALPPRISKNKSHGEILKRYNRNKLE